MSVLYGSCCEICIVCYCYSSRSACICDIFYSKNNGIVHAGLCLFGIPVLSLKLTEFGRRNGYTVGTMNGC